MTGAPSVRIGVLSDTHGYLDPRVLEIFADVDHILHAGDIGSPDILTALQAVAPVTAVAGNLDSGDLGDSLPTEVVGTIDGILFVVAHKPKRLLKRLDAGRYSEEGRAPDLIVWGHLHVPTAVWAEGSLRLNPGTATAPYEEDDDPTVAIVESWLGELSVRLVPVRRTRPDSEGVESREEQAQEAK